MLNTRSKSLLYINGFLSVDVLYSGIEKKQIFTFTNLPKLLIDVKFQQQDLWCEPADPFRFTFFFLPLPFFTFSSLTGGHTLFKMSCVRRVKAWSMLSLESALVSTCRIPWFLANVSPLSFVICLWLTRSHLFATRILSTSSFAFSSIFLIHFEMLWNVFSFVTSYTIMIPKAPR